MEEKEKLYVNIQGDIISIEADGYPSRDFWYYSLEEAVERYKEIIGATPLSLWLDSSHY